MMEAMPLRLMILGGGSSQLNAFRRAREMGMWTILADHNPEAPARTWADAFAPASTFDTEAVVAAARDHGVDALLALGTDQPVLTAARVSHRLGLPFPLSPEQALLLTNKAPMKQRFAAAGIPSVPWALIDENEDRWDEQGLGALDWPVVVKPVDSQGQRGIALAHDRQELRRRRRTALSFSRDRRVLVEEYYPSREVTVSGWAHDPEKVEIWSITDRVTVSPRQSLGVCLAHRYPSAHAGGSATERSQRIVDLTGDVVRAFQLAGGPIYFQMLVGDRGVLVNEVAFRLGGAYEDISLPLVTGVDVLARQLAAIQRAVATRRGNASAKGSPGSAGGDRTARAVPTSNAFVVPLMFARRGTVAELRGDEELRCRPEIAECRFLLPVGTNIRRMSNSTQRIAFAVIHGADSAEVNRGVDQVFDTLKVLNGDGENLLIDSRAAAKLPEV